MDVISPPSSTATAPPPHTHGQAPAPSTCREPPPAGTTAFSIEALTRRFRDRTVFEHVTLHGGPGESIAVAGVNGAGKTTLLRCVLDFARADAGRVTVFGVDSRDPLARRRIAYLPERFAPSPHLSGAETLAMLAGLQGEAWSRARIGAALEEIEFPAEALHRPVRQYSKGMTQKIGLAAVLLADRPLTVLDEPMSGLDPQARRLVTRVLQRHRERGRGLLFTSHAPADITRLCDRVAILHRGRLRFAGPPAQLLAHTRSDDLESAFLAAIDDETQARRPPAGEPR